MFKSVSRIFSICSIIVVVVVSIVGSTTVQAAPVLQGPNPTSPGQVESAPIEMVSAGGGHTCWLKSDGTVACWGTDIDGISTPPAGTFKQISAGTYHTCGVKSDGTLACWGDTDLGQSTPPGGTFIQVGAGSGHTCGVRIDGTLDCWGMDGNGQSTPPLGTFTEVSAGGWHSCGVRSDGTLACWGDDSQGQSTPPNGTFRQVSVGTWHSCGLKSDGTVACWGAGTTNTGGDPEYGQSMPPAGTFKQIDVAHMYACGIKSDGIVVCWGMDNAGQDIPPYGSFTQVSAGDFHGCGLYSNGTLTCWGDNSSKQSLPFTISGRVGCNSETQDVHGEGGGGGCSSAAGISSEGAGIAGGGGGCWGEAGVTGKDADITGGGGAPLLYYYDGISKTATWDSNGDYSFQVSYNWSGTVLPYYYYGGIGFVPYCRSYSNVLSDQADQNYAFRFPQGLILPSLSAHDGWVLESSEKSGTGKTLNASDPTFNLGDDASNRQYRAILSFDTASLPDDAIIQSATLRIKRSGAVVGKNPFAVLGQLWADISHGPFGTASLRAGDFSANAWATKVGSFNKIAENGWYTLYMDTDGLNKTGLTQLRLYFGLDDNNNRAADYMKFLSGNAADGRPELAIVYTLP